MVANWHEQRSRFAGDQTIRPHTLENSFEEIIVPNTPPAGEPQGGTTIALVVRTPERFQGPPKLIPALASESQGTPEAQVQPPALTALQGSNMVLGRGAACLISCTATASTSYD